MSALNNIIPIPHDHGANFTAQVKAVSEQGFEISKEHTVIQAKKAFSCLIEPMENDTVLCNFDEHNQVYIIAILDRQNNQQGHLELPSNTVINCQNDLTIRSGNKTAFISDSIQQISKNCLVKSENAVMKLQNMMVEGKKLHTYISAVHTVSDIISTSARQALQKFTSYMRKSEQVDQVHAGQMGRKVDGLYNLDSKHTIMVSKKETKIDGEHIHMG